MSKHPIPDWLRSQFSRIEDEVQKLGPCGVFTQMRTVTQTYFEQQAAAPQPPALCGEPDAVAFWADGTLFHSREAAGRFSKDVKAMVLQEDHRAQLATLQAEIEDYKAGQDRYEKLCEDQRTEISQLKARCDELEGFLKSAKYVVEAARTIEKIAFREGTQNVNPASFRGLGILLEQYDAALSRPAGSES